MVFYGSIHNTTKSLNKGEFNLTETIEETKPQKPRGRAQKSVPQVVQEVELPEQTIGTIAVDNGGQNIKVFAEHMEFPIHFKSDKTIGDIRDIDEPPLNKDHSFVIQWKDNVYLTNHRKRLGKYPNSMTGNVSSKANDYFILSTIIAVALYGYDVNYLVTSIPYENRFKKGEVEKITDILVGNHSIVIDKELYEFEIADVYLATEAQAGHFHLQKEGVVTLLEIGSRTVGYATNEFVLDDNGEIKIDQPIHEKTGTLARKGVQISDIKNDNEYKLYVYDIFANLSQKIDEDDEIVAFGGGILIEPIKEALSEVYHNITFAENPLYVQVLGMLEMGKIAFDYLYNGEDIE